MYIDLQRNTRTRRDRKALARKLHRDLVRTGYKNPEMAAWDVARGVVRTMRRLNQHWYRSSLGFMCQEDSPAVRLYIRHRYRRVLQRLDTIEEPDLSLPIDAIEGEYTVILRGKNRVKPPEPIVNAAPPTVLLGTWDKTTRLPDGTIYHGDPNMLAPPKGTVRDPNVLPSGLPYPPQQKLIHFASKEAMKNSSIVRDASGRKRRIVGEATDSGIVNTMEINPDGTMQPFTGTLSFGIHDVSTRAPKVNTSVVPFRTAGPEEKRPALTSLRASGENVAELPDGARVITKHPDHVPGVGAGYTVQKVEHLEGGAIHVTQEKPDGTVYPVGELFFPTITVGSEDK